MKHEKKAVRSNKREIQNKKGKDDEGGLLNKTLIVIMGVGSMVGWNI